MSLTEDRDVKISLAKEKLKKFQKKKANHGETNSQAGDSVNGSVGDTSLRSSPGLDGRVTLPLHDNESINFGDTTGHSLNGNHDRYWENTQARDVSSDLHDDIVPSGSGDFMESYIGAVNGHGEVNREEIQRLKATVEDLVNRNRLLTKEIEIERNSVESKVIGEHQNLREQLNSHIQTIGILVAEKTELQAALTQADFMAKKKAAEAESYSTKLADLREKMTDHERSLSRSNLNGEAHAARLTEQASDLAKLKETNTSLEGLLDGLRDEIFECKRKLGLKDVEMKALQDRNQDLQNQLTTVTTHSDQSQKRSSVTDLQQDQEKRKLENRVHEYQSEITRLQLDMEQMVSRYQILLTQANQSRDAKLVDPVLISRISELEVANDQLRTEFDKIQVDQVKERQSLQDKNLTIEELETQVLQQETTLNQQKSLIEDHLHKSGQDQEEILLLRTSHDQLTARLTDHSNLLHIMESDKVALSRAMTQNKDMKDRLEVLMAELDLARQDRVFRDHRIAVLENELKSSQNVDNEAHQGQSQTEGEEEKTGNSPSPAYLKAFEGKVRNLEDEVTMYKNRQLQADSEVIYLKNALRIREEEARLLDLTEKVGAYRHLEHRFVVAMKQNAEFAERVDQLEHVIMQLQGETETIGDYIALYQSQRSLQRQREMEKVAQIDFLNQERATLKEKLTQLQAVVRSHLQYDQPVARSHHINLEQSGDVPDTSPSPATEGESLTVTVVTSDPDRVNAVNGPSEKKVILQLLDEIDGHIQQEPPPTSLSSFSSSSTLNAYLAGQSMPECSCCIGDLKMV